MIAASVKKLTEVNRHLTGVQVETHPNSTPGGSGPAYLFGRVGGIGSGFRCSEKVLLLAGYVDGSSGAFALSPILI